jgi:hypothetical protein
VDELAILIDAFRAENADRLQLVHEMEAQGGDAAAAFLASVAGDERAEDYVRVEALKAMRLWSIESAQVRRDIGDRLVSTLTGSDDDLVRGYAGMALSNFFDVPGVFDALRVVVVDHDEDEDVRHNALDALEDHLSDARVQGLMAELAALDGSIGAEARRKTPLRR